MIFYEFSEIIKWLSMCKHYDSVSLHLSATPSKKHNLSEFFFFEWSTFITWSSSGQKSKLLQIPKWEWQPIQRQAVDLWACGLWVISPDGLLFC